MIRFMEFVWRDGWNPQKALVSVVNLED